jgi:hypothetical protein
VKALGDILAGKPADWSGIGKEYAAYILHAYNTWSLDNEYPLLMRRDIFPVVPLCHFVRPGYVEVVPG